MHTERNSSEKSHRFPKEQGDIYFFAQKEIVPRNLTDSLKNKVKYIFLKIPSYKHKTHTHTRTQGQKKCHFHFEDGLEVVKDEEAKGVVVVVVLVLIVLQNPKRTKKSFRDSSSPSIRTSREEITRMVAKKGYDSGCYYVSACSKKTGSNHTST